MSTFSISQRRQHSARSLSWETRLYGSHVRVPKYPFTETVHLRAVPELHGVTFFWLMVSCHFPPVPRDIYLTERLGNTWLDNTVLPRGLCSRQPTLPWGFLYCFSLIFLLLSFFLQPSLFLKPGLRISLYYVSQETPSLCFHGTSSDGSFQTVLWKDACYDIFSSPWIIMLKGTLSCNLPLWRITSFGSWGGMPWWKAVQWSLRSQLCQERLS